MKAVIQRVSSAAVTVQGEKRTIGRGLVILIGIAPADTEKDAEFLAKKIAAMRSFKDTKEKKKFDPLCGHKKGQPPIL